MTQRMSTGLTNFLAKYGSFDDALQNGAIDIYTGVQPASADAAPTGTLLCTITDNSGAQTQEVQSTGTVTLTGGASGSVNSVLVNSVDILGAAVPFNATLTQTAADVAAQINRNNSAPDYTASSSGAVITITAKRGAGTSPNTFTVSSTLTTITASYVAMAGGVNPVNGLKFDTPVGGVMAMRTSQVWAGNNANGGQAGWFRFRGSVVDSGALDTIGNQIRCDGAVSTAGAELNLNNVVFVASANTKLATATVTVPA